MKKIAALLCLLSAAALPLGAQTWTAPAPEDLVLYHLMPDRFNNGDSSNDDGNPRAAFAPTNPRGFHGGDLEGIRQKLPYLRRLGVNGIWMTPFLENVSEYHGYATYDWYKVDPNYGDLAKLRQLIDEAHSQGIAVYFDMVAGHCGDLINAPGSSGYPAYRPPPDTYTLRWRNTNRYPAPFNSLTYFHAHGHIGDFNAPEQELGELSGLDDLKTETEYVRTEMLKIWEYWVTETGVDGFRVDTVKHVDRGFWEFFLPELRAHAEGLGRENFFVFGEIYGADDNYMAEYLGTLDGAPYKFDAAVDFQYYYASGGVFATANSAPSNLMDRLSGRATRLGVHHLQMPNFFDNHDVPRFLSTANGNAGSGLAERLRRLELALVSIMTSPGPPIIYYGTEQAFDGGNDPNNREDMFDGQFETGPSLGDNFDESHRLYRWTARLATLRHALAPLRRGSFQVLHTSRSGPGPAAYRRALDGAAVLVVLNTSTSTQNLPSLVVPEFAGETVANALDTTERITLDAEGRFPARVLAAQAGEVWLKAADVPPSPPDVLAFSPADGDQRVPLDLSQLRITFATPMDPATTSGAISIAPTLGYTLAWEDGDQTAVLTLGESPAPLSSYTVTVAATAESAEGAALSRTLSARWTTDRAPLELLPLPAPTTLASVPWAPVIDANPADWNLPTDDLVQDSAVISGEGVWMWTDALGDDKGPGLYVYPTNGAFSGNEADIRTVGVVLTPQSICFLIRPAGINSAASFFTPYFGIAIDMAEGGVSHPLGFDQSNPGVRGVTELEVRDDSIPEWELTVTGPRGAMLLPAGDGAEVVPVTSAFSQSTGWIEVEVPRTALGLTGPLANQRFRLVIYSAFETFGAVREVQQNGGEWDPGGGIVQTSDPDVFDLIGGTGLQQRDDLGNWDAVYPAVVRHSVINLQLSDEQGSGSAWMVF